MSKTMHELKGDLEEEIKREMHRLVDNRNYADELSEMVDDWIPDNHGELADLLCSDNRLALVENSETLPEIPTVWGIIQASLREQLLSYAESTFQELKDEFEEGKDDFENEGYEVEPKDGEYNIVRKIDDPDNEYETIKTGFTSEYEAVKWWIDKGPV